MKNILPDRNIAGVVDCNEFKPDGNPVYRPVAAFAAKLMKGLVNKLVEDTVDRLVEGSYDKLVEDWVGKSVNILLSWEIVVENIVFVRCDKDAVEVAESRWAEPDIIVGSSTTNVFNTGSANCKMGSFELPDKTGFLETPGCKSDISSKNNTI